MSSLKPIEKVKLERLFKMEGGYVLGYSDSTFNVMIAAACGIDSNDRKYKLFGTSKANRLRGIWDIESDEKVGNIIQYILEEQEASNEQNSWTQEEPERSLTLECYQIAKRLIGLSPTSALGSVLDTFQDESTKVLISSIRGELSSDNPVGALDRVHTLAVKYFRNKLNEFGITTEKTQPLHGIYGQFVKQLREKKLIESEMTEKILRSINPILEKFSDIRNNRSLAHDNILINPIEAVYILNSIGNAINLAEGICSAEKVSKISPC